MTEVIAGQTVALLSQWYAYEGGPLTDLDGTPTIGITHAATGTVALAATTTGITHPSTGTYVYTWVTASSLTPGAYLALWSGTKSGSPVTATETITVTGPIGGRSYATVAQYDAYPGTTVSATTEQRLVEATALLDARVLFAAWYDVDSGGLPTDSAVAAAFARAVCAQVRWWDELGGSTTGADSAGWGSVSIGSVALSRPSSSGASGADSPAQQIAPTVWDELRSLQLVDAFTLGVIA